MESTQGQINWGKQALQALNYTICNGIRADNDFMLSYIM